MKIQYLGSAASEGWPALFCHCDACRKARELGGKNIRTRSQAIVDDCLLLDFPPDAYSHMLRENLDFGGIQTLLVTHSHSDHFYPLDLVMRMAPYAYQQGAPSLTVYGDNKVEQLYLQAIEEENCPALNEALHFQRLSPFETFQTAEGYTVTSLEARHGLPEEECLLYLIEKDGKTLFYSHDTGLYPEETWKALEGRHLDFVSLDCTGLFGGAGGSHMSVSDNRLVKQRLTEMGCADENTRFAINHFSHNGKLMHDEITERVRKDGFLVSYDGLSVTF